MGNESSIFKTCLNRFLGQCKGCDRDYNIEHHPNNYDCPRHIPFSLLIFDVKEKDLKNKDNKIK